LIWGTREFAIIGDVSGCRVRPPLLGAKRGCLMGLEGWRFVNRTCRVRAVVIGVLEELPFICPVVVAIGSLIMIGVRLCEDWPQ
jgi:hypothetical protein